MAVGKSIPRVDAYEKVSGRAKFTEDLMPKSCYVAKVLHSTIGNGRVVSIDTGKAEALPGVIKVVTFEDVPKHCYPTPGHPWSVEKAHQDIADRRMLTDRVRYYGDDIAAVVAEDEVIASRALKLIQVEYEEYPVQTNPYEAMKGEGIPVHEEKPDNIVARSEYELGHVDERMAQADLIAEEDYATSPVQHCHIETPVSYAYMEQGRIIVVSSTQIPHIMRRVIGQALGISWGKIRVIKPYIGGGFGNKQDVLYEPLNAFLTTQVGGRPVKLEISREETFVNTRTRHEIFYHLKMGLTKEGRIIAKDMEAVSNQGAYASHAHAIVANGATAWRHLYDVKDVRAKAYTVYTNYPVGGAMRGYGIPQVCFAIEAFMDDAAAMVGMDPLEFRRKNVYQGYFQDPYLKEIAANSNGVMECMEKGAEFIGWKKKREEYKNQTGNLRRGVGMAIFSYKTGVWPISLEITGARMVMNQDGSMQLMVGATEIGQGADTVFTQMAAETLSMEPDRIHLVSFQDTDVTPFDTGAYASRQTYVTGEAVRQCAELMKEKILAYAKELLEERKTKAGEPGEIQGDFDLAEEKILLNGEPVLTLEELGLESYYSLTNSSAITAEVSLQKKNNAISFGATFAEVEVDISLGKVKVLQIINVHDSGKIINPQLATMQVHGGMSMGLGYGLSEQMLIDEKTGKVLNGNLLDYKLPTMMDSPDLHAAFVETEEPTGPYGNKALGEPPAIPPAPAIRNAVLHATGVGINKIPLSPQRMIEAFTKAGLLKGGYDHV